MIIYTYIYIHTRIDCLCPAWLWKKVELSQHKFAKTYAKNIIAWHGKFGTTSSKFHNSSILYAKFHTWFPPLENASIQVLISILVKCPMIFYSILLTSQRLRVKYTSSCLANRIPSVKKHEKNPLKQLHPKNLNLTKPSKKKTSTKKIQTAAFQLPSRFGHDVIFPNPWHHTPLHHTCRAAASQALCWHDFELNRRHKPPPVAPKRRSLDSRRVMQVLPHETIQVPKNAFHSFKCSCWLDWFIHEFLHSGICSVCLFYFFSLSLYFISLHVIAFYGMSL